MSLLSRLFGKPTPAENAPATSPPDDPAESPPQPDPAARAREEEASVSEAIAAGDTAAIARWVLEGSSTRVRQRAAQAVTGLDPLHELIRATRHGKDKSVYRILATKRDELLAEIRRNEQQQADVAAAAAAIAHHSGQSFHPTYAAALAQLESRWRALAPHAAPDLQREVEAQLATARQVIERHEQAVEAEGQRQRAAALATEEARLRRQAEAEAAAATAAEEAQRLEAERAAEHAKQEADAAEVRNLLGLLRQAQAALDHGGTARAARLRSVIAEKRPAAPELPPWFDRRVEQLDARLEELKDWKSFRVAPKQAELVARMQSLVGADLSPEALAQQIRRLRDEWRTLHRGAGDDTTPQWQEFQAAAERAYEPCREHFARQAEQRRENQARREALLERLQALAEQQQAEPADWRTLRQVLFEARREWRQYAPVEQAAVKPLQARFHAVLKELEAPLEAEYTRNAQAKRELVARAAELVNLEDTRQAISEAKSLQRSWKAVGIVERRVDNALWGEFRHHCDAIFARSSQESAAYAASLEASVARATGLCEELERMADRAEEDWATAAARLDGARNEFESLELPRTSVRELRQRFSRAVRAAEEARRHHRAQAARRAWTELFAAAAQVQAYARGHASSDSGDSGDGEALRDAAVSAIAGLAEAPRDARGLLEQHVERIAAGTVDADPAANAAALRQLCIRAELIAGVETPPEDLELRREYQMQRLVQSMQRGDRVTPAELDDLALEWIVAGPVEAGLYDALRARFQRAHGTTHE